MKHVLVRLEELRKLVVDRLTSLLGSMKDERESDGPYSDQMHFWTLGSSKDWGEREREAKEKSHRE